MAVFEVVVTAETNEDRKFWKDFLSERLLTLVSGVSIYEGWGAWISPRNSMLVSEPHYLLRVYVDDPAVIFAGIQDALLLYKNGAQQEVVLVVADGTPYFLNDQVFAALQVVDSYFPIK